MVRSRHLDRTGGVVQAYLGTGSGLRTLFLVMLGLMAFSALIGASALAAVPI